MYHGHTSKAYKIPLRLVQYEEHATYRDPESLEEVPLVPGMSRTDNMLRWGFIKKVQ